MKRAAICFLCLWLCLSGALPAFAGAEAGEAHGFTRVESRWIDQEGASGTLYRHEASGLSVFHLENDSDDLCFSIGFITPPGSNRGANHVLEHAVLCGSEKYPSRNLMHHLRNTSLARTINATTNDQTTAYFFQTEHPKDYYNLMDVYMHAVFSPMVLREENIFLQQGMRWEVTADGVAPNGVVYNELRQRSLETGTSMLGEVQKALNASLFEIDTPVFSSGGEVDDLLDLTYAEVLGVYGAAYHPANALVFLSGRQDLQETFALLDNALKGVSGGKLLAPEYRLRGERAPLEMPADFPADALMDIGFAFSGIPANQPRQVYARDAMLLVAIDHLRTQWPDVYMVSDDTSGYATFMVIVSGVPAGQAQALVDDFERFLAEDIEALLSAETFLGALDTYTWMVEDGNGWAPYSTLKGFANGNDPFALVEKEQDFAYLREHPAFVHTVWQEHLVNTPYRAVASIRQQLRDERASKQFSEDALASLREKDAAFSAWVDAPETEAELACIPTLGIEDYEPSSLQHPVDAGSQEGIHYWLQPGAFTEALLAFAVSQPESQWLDLSLLARTITAEGNGTVAYLVPYDDLTQAGNVLPKFIVHPAFMEEGTGEAIYGLAEMLMNPQWITGELVANVLANEIQSVEQYLESPYSFTLEALYSDISPQDRFRGATLGLVANGTEAYLEYVKDMALQPPDAVAARLRLLAESLADREGLMVYMRGSRPALDGVLAEIVAAFPCSEGKRQLSAPPGAQGRHSLLVVAPQAEATVHYLQAGVFENTQWERNGQMDIMARVLQNGFLLPELRNKRGAYGAQVVVNNGYISLGASGISNIDDTYAVLLGASDYLRNLNMTQAYLE